MTSLPPQQTHQRNPRSQAQLWRIISVFVLLIAVVAGWGIITRLDAAHRLDETTQDNATPIVTVMKATIGPTEEEIVLPSNLQAWHEAPVYARTNGYLKKWITPIGTFVKEGDLLAEIETPEIDAQQHQAQADLHTAEANNQLAQSTAMRWQKLLKTNTVSQQEVDEKTSDALAKAAVVASAQANLDRLNQLEDFKRVTAPFDGIITARNTDIGALINAGNAGSGQELFHIADTNKLRVYVQIPQINTPAITPDLTAELHLVEYPQRIFTAKLTHTAKALSPETRTLLTEFEVDNEDGALLAGSFAEVHIKLPSNSQTVRLPINTILFNKNGSQIATLDDQNRAILKPIKIGRDYGKQLEVIDGISPGETIIINPPDSLRTGEQVKLNPSKKTTEGP